MTRSSSWIDRREMVLVEAAVTEAFDRLRQLSGAWRDVEPGDAVREAAVRFLRVHPLCAADAQRLNSYPRVFR